MARTLRISTGFVLLLAVSAGNAQSAMTTFQGQLKSNGAPANGPFELVFRLCNTPAPPGGVLQTLPPPGSIMVVDVHNGLFTQDLALDPEWLDGSDLWLEIEVNGTPVLPRQRLSYTPYATTAANLALPFASKPVGAPSCVFSITSTTTSPAICGDNISPTGNGCGVSGTAVSPDGIGVCGSAFIGVQGVGTTPNGNGVIGYASGGPDAWAVGGETATGLAVVGRAGINPPGGGFPPVTGVVGYSNDPNGTGVYGQAAGTFGRGVFGIATSANGPNYGVFGSTGSSFGSGVFGEHTATSGLAYGGRFETRSTEGRAVRGYATALSGTNYGGYFVSDSNTGYGVYGLGGGGLGTSYGVYGQSTARSGIGVYGFASDPTTSNNYGVMGESRGTFGRGVVGYAKATTGTTYGLWGQSDSTSGTGVYGYASAGSGTIYGVYGQASTSFAVYANGNLGASGTKSFRIDHPDDPANKYLLHYAAESPEVINFYRGTVVLDEAGQAVVALPHYFAKINKDPSYVLTAIGAPMPQLHVAEEIDATTLNAGAVAGPADPSPPCSFRIAGGVPGAKVSWRVEAVRNDPWLQQRGAPVEQDKDEAERGTYQHPELYGMPADQGPHVPAPQDLPGGLQAAQASGPAAL